MNAPVRADRLILGDVDDFAECCAFEAWFVDEGWKSKQLAVDHLQNLAELWGLIEEIGQDAVQAVMAEAFAPAPDLPSDYGSHLLMQWELTDPRDRWRWTGELPPAPEPQPEWPPRRPYQTPESTVDAFNYVVRQGDPARLAAWLRNHPDDASTLLRTLEAA